LGARGKNGILVQKVGRPPPQPLFCTQNPKYTGYSWTRTWDPRVTPIYVIHQDHTLGPHIFFKLSSGQVEKNVWGEAENLAKSMYEKAIFFFEIRKNPLKTGNFLKNLPRFSSKKFRAAAQKFPGTPLGKKQLRLWPM
jgi:hypothetical protein